MELAFLGAAGTVTGARFLVETESRRVLVDCGLFQGHRDLRRRNWNPLPIAPHDIDAVVLTHAHLDHSGYLPLLVAKGFAGRVFCSSATKSLCEILLPDSAHLQEEDAAYANKKGFSKHRPALPLYTRADAEEALSRLTPIAWKKPHYLGGGLTATLHPAGHILGAAIVVIGDGSTTIAFSGDLGRPNDLVMVPPTRIPHADYVVIESTYGDKEHDPAPKQALIDAITRTLARGGTVLIPAFAVGRAQTLLYALHELRKQGVIDDVPIFLNSPMAADATEVFCAYSSEHRLDAQTCRDICEGVHFVRDVADSRSLDLRPGPKIIVSASGMLTGGRVLHHVKALGPDPRNTILLVGYQAEGTRGAALIRGERMLRIHGEDHFIRAEIVALDGLSAHADASELLDWLRGFERPPIRTFITHGSPQASRALAGRIEKELGWSCAIPEHLERVKLRRGKA